MSGWTKAHQSIRDELVGKTNVRVLVVEGDDDKAFITNLLDRKNSGEWASKWTVGVAGGKQQVLKILAKEDQWLGLVDCDEWSNNAAVKAKSIHSNLHVLPRFCIENYFIEPDEIWAALPKKKQTLLATSETEFKQALSATFEQWLRHGTLWHAVNPLWEGLRALGFKDQLLELATAQDDTQIKSTLNEWHDYLTPDTIFEDFQAKLTAAQADSPENQYRKWIHGKHFFKQQIVPVLNQYFDQRNAND